MRTAVLKTILLAAVLCGLILPPAQAEIRILGSAGGQVGPFLDLFERVRASAASVRTCSRSLPIRGARLDSPPRRLDIAPIAAARARTCGDLSLLPMKPQSSIGQRP